VKAALAVVLIAFAEFAEARLIGQNLFIAGDGFTIERAISDADAQRTAQDSRSYKVLVLKTELARLVDSSATPGIRQLFLKARQDGAMFYACAKDLKALDLEPSDLLTGVRVVRGFPSKNGDAVQEWEKKLPLAPDRKMRSICAAG